MNKYKAIKFLIILMLVDFCIACESNDSNKTKNKQHIATFSLKDTLRFYIGDCTSYKSFVTIFQLDNKDYLLTQVNKTNNVIVFDVEKETKIIELSFPSEGPNGIGELGSIKIHNWDSIFIISAYINTIILTDTTYKIKKKWKLEKTPDGKDIFNMDGLLSYYPLEFKNNQLHFRKFSDNSDNEKYHIVFDCDKEKIVSNFLTFPENYPKEFYGFSSSDIYTIINNKGKIISSFALTPDIYVRRDSLIEKICTFNSKNVNKLLPTPPSELENASWQEIYNFEKQKDDYYYMVYDSFRNFVYRIILHPLENIESSNPMDIFDRPFSIQIIDSNFNYVGEVKFPGKTYNYLKIIACKRGLLVSIDHDKNPDLKEDYFQFHLYELQEIK